MAFLKIENVAIRGLSGCVPKNVEENIDLPFYTSREEAEKVIAATGIERRHVAPVGTTASDLCHAAAERLLTDLGWDKGSVDLLAFCTQTPDYLNHPDSFVVHEALGLPETTICLDFFHGCPGWVVSLSAVAQLVSSGKIKRALLLDGDTVSQHQTPTNREERPLFGDGGVAAALEYDPTVAPMYFNIGTKSDDGKALALLNGGFKTPYTRESFDVEMRRLEGLLHDGETVQAMDSMDIFSFAITKVPKALKKLCGQYDIDINNIDRLILHQANKLIVDTIAKRIKTPAEKVVIGLRNFGNTTSASIPLAMVSECAQQLRNDKVRNLVCGFGTGLAWAAAYFETDKIIVPEIIEL